MRMERGNHLGPVPTGRAGNRSGFTLLELVIVAGVLLFALLMFTQTMGSSMALTGVNRETSLASEGARDALERLQGEDFALLFANHAASAGFAVPGLDPLDDDADGLVGEFRFPSVSGAAGPELREDVVDERLGMPRDLNGDGVVDALDHRNDYRLLPVAVTLRWKGQSGPRTLELETLIADR